MAIGRTGSLDLGSDEELISAVRNLGEALQSGACINNLHHYDYIIKVALDRAELSQEGIDYLAHRPTLKRRRVVSRPEKLNQSLQRAKHP